MHFQACKRLAAGGRRLACEDGRRRRTPGRTRGSPAVDVRATDERRGGAEPDRACLTTTRTASLAAPLHAQCGCTSEQPRNQADLGCVSGSHAGRAASPSRSPGARGRSCRGGQLRRIRHQLLGPPCPARKLRTPAVEPWRSAQRGRHRWRRPARARGWTVNEIPSTPCISRVRWIGVVRS